MKYTKGRRGPESTNVVRIEFLNPSGTPGNPMAKGVMYAHLKSEKRMVSFLAQGKNAKALMDARAQHGEVLTVTMRWTARDSVTITGIMANDDQAPGTAEKAA